MAMRCIDISENRKIGNISPIAIFAFVACFVVLTAVMNPGFTYLLSVILAFILTQIFFQYTPRFVFLYIKYLFTNSKLTPTFYDEKYMSNHFKIKNLQKILPDRSLVKEKNNVNG